MGEVLTIKDSLIITGFSMVIVFVGLIIISFIIGLLGKFGGKKKQVTDEPKAAPAAKAAAPAAKTATNDEEIVAAIAAAVAASMGVGVGEIVVRNIQRVGQETTTWTQAGMQEQMLMKL